MPTSAETILNDLENSPEMLLEKARKYDQARLKHNKRCYKYYFENHEEMKTKRKEYAKKYYQQQDEEMKAKRREYSKKYYQEKKEKLKAQEIPSL